MKECKNCGAIYKPGRWEYGRYEGTTTIFECMGTIPETQCPVCRKEQPERETA